MVAAAERRESGRRFPIDGPSLRRLRERRAKTVRELAGEANVNVATISAAENGRRRSINSKTARKLAEALDVLPEELSGTYDPDLIERLRRMIEATEESYFIHLAGGQVIDARYEDDLASLYAKLAVAHGGTEEAIKDVLLKAITAGKQRGLIIAEQERSD